MPVRVLIVEDNRDLREAFVSLCTLWGYQTADAADGPDALALVESFVPDVLIVDIGLPGSIRGDDVARRLRAACGDRLFIVVLTGWTGAAGRETALSVGADVVFEKPADLNDLRNTLERAAARTAKRGSA